MCECCCGKQEGNATAAEQSAEPLEWFAAMLENCLQYARAAKAAGQPIVGILCEYTPRELILAAGAVPVCLCGGSAKTIPAAEEFLPANLCPLIKSTFGYHVLKNNPFLEMADLIVAETTCDGKKKMYELMAETREVYLLELPQMADAADAGEHWRAELGKFRDFLQSRFRTEITPCRLREAVAVMNRERQLRRELAALMQADPPPLSGRQLLSMRSSISGVEADFEQYERAIARYRSPPPATAAPADPRADDRRADGHRRGAGAGDHRAERRLRGRHGKLHGTEADPGRRRRRGPGPASSRRR